MAQPSLSLGNVGFIFQGIGSGGRAQVMDTQAGDLDAGTLRINAYQGVDAIGCNAGAS